MSATRGTTLASTHWVVNRIHAHAAIVRAPAHPTRSTGLAPIEVAMLQVAQLSNGRPTVEMNPPNLPGRQADLTPVALLGQKLSSTTGATHELPTAADLELDIVNHSPLRNVTERQRVARLNVRNSAGNNRLAHLQLGRSENVRLLTVSVVQQRDVRRSVWIVLDTGNDGGYAKLLPLEVYRAVAALVPTSTEAACRSPSIIAAAGRSLANDGLP
jgi:hypothetical protein